MFRFKMSLQIRYTIAECLDLKLILCPWPCNIVRKIPTADVILHNALVTLLIQISALAVTDMFMHYACHKEGRKLIV